MKVKVIAKLNKRLWPSTKNTPLPNPHLPGDIIEVESEVEGEAPLNATNTRWYKAKGGYYVWSGGVLREDTVKMVEYDRSAFDWWHTQYSIKEVWSKLGVRGEGVNIAVIDTGVSLNHPALVSKRNAPGKDYTNTTYGIDNFAHGTPVAGIIFAEAQSIGIAPRASLYVVKIVDTGTFSAGTLLRALRGLPAGIDIVVISHAFPCDEFNHSLTADFIQAASGKLIICGAGNYSNHNDPPVDYYPAALDGFIAVGACDSNNTIAYDSVKSNRIHLCAPGVDMKVLNPFDHANPMTGSGTSYAAPFVAGIAALMKSYCRKKSKPLSNAQLVTYLETTATKTSPNQNAQIYGAGIINPINAIKKIVP